MCRLLLVSSVFFLLLLVFAFGGVVSVTVAFVVFGLNRGPGAVGGGSAGAGAVAGSGGGCGGAGTPALVLYCLSCCACFVKKRQQHRKKYLLSHVTGDVSRGL